MGSRMRINKSARDNRRSQIKVIEPRTTVDTETGSIHLRHRVDMKTGMYRGRQVINVGKQAAKQAARNDRKRQARQDNAADEETADSDVKDDSEMEVEGGDKNV